MNLITNTGIIKKNYNSRGLISHNFVDSRLVRQENGTLWAAIAEQRNSVNALGLYRSTDSGFSWEKIDRDFFSPGSQALPGISNVSHNGPAISLQINEKWNKLAIYYSIVGDPSIPTFSVRFAEIPLSDVQDGTLEHGTVVPSNGHIAFAAPYTLNKTYIVYVFNGRLSVVKRSWPGTTGGSSSAVQTLLGTASVNPYFDAVGHKDGYIDAAASAISGTTRLYHARYIDPGSGWGPAHLIADTGDAGSKIVDVSIARDGYNNLLVAWGQINSANTDISLRYSISKDGGNIWSAPVTISREAGHSAYRDSLTNEWAARCTVLGGRSRGFFLGYVDKNSSGIPKSHVRPIDTADGFTYTLQAEREIATKTSSLTDAVVGLRWFQPPGTVLLELADPTLVRVGFQRGEGNSPTQDDQQPTEVGQELLGTSAYAYLLEPSTTEYASDSPTDEDLLVSINVVGSFDENVDFYAEGLKGKQTERFIAAFEKLGTSLRFLRYLPLAESAMADRSAYGPPSALNSRVIITPETYDVPLANRGSDTFTSFIERDIRKLFLPPNFYLSRAFVLNAGNYLKRTVWLVEFDSNLYEVTQVVPYLINNEICYYQANAYVVGPSHDPFSKVILPSET